MEFLRNTWYVAAWSHELDEAPLFHRTILNEPLLLFRQEDGSVAAIGNRCPHRFAPLHMGCLKNGGVVCAYHGLEFDGSGRCRHNPQGNGAIPKAAQVKSYPVAERHLAIWVWMGDPDSADPALIPDYSFLSAAKPTARNTGYMSARCNYLLMCDNIMDLSHVDFLHPTTLGGGALSRAKPEVSESDGRVRILWEANNEVAPPAFARHLADPSAPVNLWTDVVWSAPSLMHLRTGVAPVGAPEAEGLYTANLHMMTPETETSTHYFYANSRSFLQEDGEFNRMLDGILTDVFSREDKGMIEAQQAMMNTTDLWSLKPVLLPADAGAVRVRRMLERLIGEEKGKA